MKRIIEGTKKYSARVFEKRRDLFEPLVAGQTPVALFITCSDSRIDPELLTESEPGRLFIIRNGGNIVPRFSRVSTSESGTIELAVAGLNVDHIIVCGHTRCAAVGGILFPNRVKRLPILTDWLSNADTNFTTEEREQLDENSTSPTWAIERHVNQQLENLRSHPAVAYAEANNRIHLHGWIYHLEDGSVTAYSQKTEDFRPLDEVYSEAI